jgi:Mor family transcriptional regulator
MAEPAVRTATRWAWQALSQNRRFDAAHKLTLLALADVLDQAAAANARDMFAPDVLAAAVSGVAPADLADAVGVTTVTARRYLIKLLAHELVETANGRTFTLPASAWAAATDQA